MFSSWRVSGVITHISTEVGNASILEYIVGMVDNTVDDYGLDRGLPNPIYELEPFSHLGQM